MSEVRRRLAHDGPPRTRGRAQDFQTVTLPEKDCDLLRDLLIAEGVTTVVEVGLAYGSSALAVGEALVAAGLPGVRHIIIDPFQDRGWSNAGWELLCSAGLDTIASLLPEWSSIALPRLLADGLVADAAFVDGSHRFHEVFVDLYFLRKIVRPGGLIIMDDDWAPSVRTAAHYFEQNLGWMTIPGVFGDGTHRHPGHPRRGPDPDADPDGVRVPRCRAYRLPGEVTEPAFADFRPF